MQSWLACSWTLDQCLISRVEEMIDLIEVLWHSNAQLPSMHAKHNETTCIQHRALRTGHRCRLLLERCGSTYHLEHFTALPDPEPCHAAYATGMPAASQQHLPAQSLFTHTVPDLVQRPQVPGRAMDCG